MCSATTSSSMYAKPTPANADSIITFVSLTVIVASTRTSQCFALALEPPTIDRPIRRPAVVDASVLAQVMRRHRCASRRHIRWRCDHRPAQVGRQPYSYHVTLDMRPGSDPGVEAFCDDVGHAVVNDQIENDIRIKLRELSELREEHDFCREPWQIEAKSAAWVIAKRADFTDGILNFRHCRDEPAKQRGTRFRWRNATRRPVEKLCAQPLQSSNDMAERGWGNAKTGGSSSEAAFLRDSSEGPQFPKLRCPRHCCVLLNNQSNLYRIVASVFNRQTGCRNMMGEDYDQCI